MNLLKNMLPLIAFLALPVSSCRKQESTGPAQPETENSARPSEEPAAAAAKATPGNGEPARPAVRRNAAPDSNPAPAPSPAPPGTETAEKKRQPEILKDLSTIKLEKGAPSPKVGDPIYTLATLPQGECGVFWVKDEQGFVTRVAVCTGDHEGGH